MRGGENLRGCLICPFSVSNFNEKKMIKNRNDSNFESDFVENIVRSQWNFENTKFMFLTSTTFYF